MTTKSNLPSRIAEGTTTVHDVGKIQAIIFAFLLGGCFIGAAVVLVASNIFGG